MEISNNQGLTDTDTESVILRENTFPLSVSVSTDISGILLEVSSINATDIPIPATMTIPIIIPITSFIN